MDYQLSQEFRKKYKRQNVRLKRLIDKTLLIFSKNPHNMLIKNHELEREWSGFRSISIGDIKNDYRAVYKEIDSRSGKIAYFYTFGTHEELYSSQVKLL